jgi:hypothetical protein
MRFSTDALEFIPGWLGWGWELKMAIDHVELATLYSKGVVRDSFANSTTRCAKVP